MCKFVYVWTRSVRIQTISADERGSWIGWKWGCCSKILLWLHTEMNSWCVVWDLAAAAILAGLAERSMAVSLNVAGALDAVAYDGISVVIIYSHFRPRTFFGFFFTSSSSFLCDFSFRCFLSQLVLLLFVSWLLLLLFVWQFFFFFAMKLFVAAVGGASFAFGLAQQVVACVSAQRNFHIIVYLVFFFFLGFFHLSIKLLVLQNETTIQCCLVTVSFGAYIWELYVLWQWFWGRDTIWN